MEWLEFVVNNPVFVALAKTLVHFAWQGLLLAAFLLVLLKSIDNRYSNLRYSLSLFVLVLCVIAPIATFSTVYEPLVETAAVDVKQAISAVSDSAVKVGVAIGALNDANHVPWSIATTELVDSISEWRIETISPFLAIAWMAGVVLMSGRLILQMVNVYKLPHQGISAPEAELQQTFDRLMEQLGVNLAARLFISTKVDVPMVIGWLKPVVLLPSAMVVGLTPKQLEMLLAHELAHVRRHDYMVNFLQTLVEVMLFFHPGVKWISKQIRVERECCCDDVAIEHCGSPVAYASALTDAEMSRYTNIPQLAMAASGSDLKHRVFRVVGQADCSSGFNGHWMSGMLAAMSSLTIVFFMFSADVIGMTSHTDKKDKKDPFMVLVEPPASGVAETPVLTEQAQAEVIPPFAATESVSNQEIIEQVSVQEETLDAQIEDSQPQEVLPETTDVVDEITNAPVESDNVESPVATVEAETLDTPAEEVVVAAPQIQTPSETVVEETANEEPFTPVMVAVEEGPVTFTPDLDDIEETIAETQTQDVAAAPAEEAMADSGVDLTQQVADIESIVLHEPVLLKGSTPSYPRRALLRKWSDDVMVTFVVNERGRVEQISFDDDVKKAFRDSVKKAVAKWQFEPAKENGEPVPMELTRLFSFTHPVAGAMTGTRIARR